MDDIEKRARALLAAEYRKGGANPAACDLLAGRASWPNQMALNAIVAALTPPEGYVLVPVKPTEAMLDAMYDNRGLSDADLENLWTETVAARPEAP